MVCLETGNLGMTTEEKKPKATQKKTAMGCLFKWPFLVCLGACSPVMATNETAPQAAFQSRR